MLTSDGRDLHIAGLPARPGFVDNRAPELGAAKGAVLVRFIQSMSRLAELAYPKLVIPVQAAIQGNGSGAWIPAFAGMTVMSLVQRSIDPRPTKGD